MLRINLYLIKEQYRKNFRLEKFDSAHNLLRLADLAESLPGRGPVDLSANLNKYAWDEQIGELLLYRLPRRAGSSQ